MKNKKALFAVLATGLFMLATVAPIVNIEDKVDTTMSIEKKKAKPRA